MTSLASPSALSSQEHARLTALLAGLPASEAWWVRHMHGPLLCALGIVEAPDSGYARAARRRFADLEHTRRRALELLAQLDRDARRRR